MSSQHKHNPIPFRPGTKPGDPDGDRAWLRTYAEQAGRAVNAVLAEALAQYRERHENHEGSDT